MTGRWGGQSEEATFLSLRSPSSTAVSDLANMLWNQWFRSRSQNSHKPLIMLNFGLESDTAVLGPLCNEAARGGPSLAGIEPHRSAATHPGPAGAWADPQVL